jgi:hypothetical protein
MSENTNPVESATSDHMNPSIKLDSDAEAPASETTVFPFNKFPKEIRDAVWQLAACEPRVVEVEFVVKRTNGRLNHNERNKYQIDHRLKSEALTPAILHTCIESRTMGKKFYERLPSREFQDIYISWDNDTIVFDDIPSLFAKIPLAISVSSGGVPADHPTCDWLCEIKEKSVRFGVHDRHALLFVRFYNHRHYFKNVKEIIVLSKTPNKGSNGEVAVARMKNRVANVTAWWERFRKRDEAKYPRHLKESIRYVHAVRNKDRLLRRERREINPGESNAGDFAVEAIEMTETFEPLQDLDGVGFDHFDDFDDTFLDDFVDV